MSVSRNQVWLMLLALIIGVGLCIPALSDHAYGAAKPAKVTNVKVKTETTTTYIVSWAKAKNAKQYQVQYKKSTSKIWSSEKTSDKKLQITGLKAGSKYQIRVRGVNGKTYGPWSSLLTKTKNKGPADPFACWPLKITCYTLEYAWYPAAGADSYEAICKEHTTTAGHYKGKKCKATFDGLWEGIGYQITVWAYKGSVRSDDCIYIETGTMGCDNNHGYGEDLKLEYQNPTSPYYNMTLFDQHQSGQRAGDEWMYPILYDEYEHPEDNGYFFVKYMNLDCADINHGTLQQYGCIDTAITDLNLKVGDSFTDLKGNTSKIQGLRLSVIANDDMVRQCSDQEEAYYYIDQFQLDILTDDSDNPFITWEMFD